MGRDVGLFNTRHKAEFQSTRPRGTRPTFTPLLVATNKFQSTRPRGTRRIFCAYIAYYGSFNPRAHVGRDINICSSRHGVDVSIHAPTWDATAVCISIFISRARFNPRAHVGRDFCKERAKNSGSVSIHAPTWDATSRAIDADSHRGFQSTRPRGTRRCWLLLYFHRFCFNPRAHVGRDMQERAVVLAGVFQSTRPRGTRHVCCQCLWHGKSFNPRAHVGRDAPSPHICTTPKSFNPRAHVGRDKRMPKSSGSEQMFQSTRPRGTRRIKGSEIVKEPSFNPRAHVGRDRALVLIINVNRLFQSTRPRGTRRLMPCLSNIAMAVSIHAPTWDATGGSKRFTVDVNVSIHAPTWDATRGVTDHVRGRGFQSTRPRGTRPIPHAPSVALRVSIHAPTWDATI